MRSTRWLALLGTLGAHIVETSSPMPFVRRSGPQAHVLRWHTVSFSSGGQRCREHRCATRGALPGKPSASSSCSRHRNQRTSALLRAPRRALRSRARAGRACGGCGVGGPFREGKKLQEREAFGAGLLQADIATDSSVRGACSDPEAEADAGDRRLSTAHTIWMPASGSTTQPVFCVRRVLNYLERGGQQGMWCP